MYVYMWLAFHCACACTWSCMHVCSFLACTTCQHGRVLDCQMRRAPGDGTMPQGLTQSCMGDESIVSKWQWMLPWGTPTGGSCNSTMNLSVTPRLPRLACKSPRPKPSTQRPLQNKEEHPNNRNFRTSINLRANSDFQGKMWKDPKAEDWASGWCIPALY